MHRTDFLPVLKNSRLYRVYTVQYSVNCKRLLSCERSPSHSLTAGRGGTVFKQSWKDKELLKSCKLKKERRWNTGPSLLPAIIQKQKISAVCSSDTCWGPISHCAFILSLELFTITDYTDVAITLLQIITYLFDYSFILLCMSCFLYFYLVFV